MLLSFVLHLKGKNRYQEINQSSHLTSFLSREKGSKKATVCRKQQKVCTFQLQELSSTLISMFFPVAVAPRTRTQENWTQKNQTET